MSSTTRDDAAERRASATATFALHWTNDQALYLAVLDYARSTIRSAGRAPRPTPQTLGRNVRDAVQRWCADGSAFPFDGPGWKTVRPETLRMLAGEVGDFRLVSETSVGEDVEEALGIES